VPDYLALGDIATGRKLLQLAQDKGMEVTLTTFWEVN
jgi:hypothetical protein